VDRTACYTRRGSRRNDHVDLRLTAAGLPQSRRSRIGFNMVKPRRAAQKPRAIEHVLSLENLVGAQQQRLRNREPECLRGFGVDHQPTDSLRRSECVLEGRLFQRRRISTLQMSFQQNRPEAGVAPIVKIVIAL